MRKGFTLLEILTVVAVIAIMTTASVLSVRQGQSGARIRGATRDIYAIIRHARSMALVSQQPSVITYSTVKDGDDVMAKIEIVTAKIFNPNQVKSAQTLSGETVKLEEDDEDEGKGSETLKKSYTLNGKEQTKETGESFKGQTVEDVLFAPVSTDVLRGIRIKVTKPGEVLDGGDEAKTKSKISVFSNVDYLIGKLQAKREVEAAKAAEAKEESEASASADEDQEPVSFVWEANGRVEAHRVWIYPDGSKPEKGLSIKIDRFGGAKVLGAGEEEED